MASGIVGSAFPDKTSVVLTRSTSRIWRASYNLLAFVQQDEAGLLERFVALLGNDLHSRVEVRLREYMFGQGDQDGLRVGLLKVLEELSKERGAHKRRAEETKKRITAIKAQPQDEATRNLVAELSRERDKALELSREIGAGTFGTLTDAGLIPNYAFPEAGIE